MHTKRLATMIALLASACTLEAGSAAWSTHPTDNLWHNTNNWTPATVPNAEKDVATFGKSSTTTVELTSYGEGDAFLTTTLGKIVFGGGAPSYTITVDPAPPKGVFLEVHGLGITNSSGVMQNLVVAASGGYSQSAELAFYNDAIVGDNLVITNQGGASADGDATYGAGTDFLANSSAGNATFINEGSTARGTVYGGVTDLLFYSSAGSATFINNPGTVAGAAAGHTLVQIYAPGGVGNSTFINNGASVAGAEGGWTEIDGTIAAGASYIAKGASVAGAQGGQVYTYGGSGYASFTAEGGSGSGVQGGLIDLFYAPATSETVVTAEGGSNGGLGGTILIEGSADIPLPQIQVFGNGMLDLTNVSDPEMPIGSLAGDGLVLLAGHGLDVGHNDLDTTYSGTIEQDGSLSKAGLGTLTLSGASTYTGGTTVSTGALVVSNTTGSGTGTGSVAVNGGTLGGGGTISGAVTVGTGSGSGATLQPSFGTNQKIALMIGSQLTIQSDGTYNCHLRTRQAEVIANGLTIGSGAQFILVAPRRKFRAGASATVMSNTSANATNGTFANLPDGATITSGGNTYQASYEGGDGNDLTLTVLP